MNAKLPTTRKRRRTSGQVEVETAIVLPVVTFLLLGLIQLGLLHQARLVSKYAAYHAARTGALNGLDQVSMEKSALAAALPILSFDKSGAEVLLRTDTVANYKKKWEKAGFGGHPQNQMQDISNMKYVEVKVCGPLRSDVSGHTYTADGGQFVPFDDPDIAGKNIDTKLRVQVTLNYRMIIPFADWVIYHMYRGWKFTKDLHLGEGEKDASAADKYDSAALNDKVYIIPIPAHYAMKMHSDAKLDNFPSSNECL